MNDIFIIKVLDKASNFISESQITDLKNVLEEELNNYELQTKVTSLAVINSMYDKIAVFLASKKLDGRSKSTIESYQRCLIRFNQSVQKDVSEVTAMDVRMFLSMFSRNEAKNTTLATNISILKSFFGWLHNEDMISKNPMVKIPTTKVEKHLRKPLTFEELELLRMACKSDRDSAIIEFFYSTGCRLDEVFKLNKSDINWFDGSLHVIGKGDKERVVYLNAKSKVHLKKYLNGRNDNNEALFVSERYPYNRLGKRGIEMIFNELGEKAGIKSSVYPHLLRHTTATNMLNSGASLMEVQRYLGHDNPSTTQIYAELDVEAVRYSHKKHVI